MKMVQDYSFEEINVPLKIDYENTKRSNIFGTKGKRAFSRISD